VSGVKTDFGSYRRTFSYSRILLNDPKKPIADSAGPPAQKYLRARGFNGLDVGNAKVNSVDLPKTFRPLRTSSSVCPVSMPGGPTRSSIRTMSDSKLHLCGRQRYRFVAEGKNTVTSFAKEIESPDEITLLEPKAGSILFRNEDVHLRWDGKRGQGLRLLISSFDAKSNVPVKPLLQLSIEEAELHHDSSQGDAERACEQRRSVPLFAHFIEQSHTTVQGYTDGNIPVSVLVQAASIHNVLLWLK